MAAQSKAPTVPTEEVSLDTIHSDVWHLYHLLDVISGELSEANTSHERVEALAWIARDRAEQIGLNIDNNYQKMRHH